MIRKGICGNSVYEFEVLKEDGTAYSLESFRGPSYYCQ